jgi:uncharacterized membrane protein YfcA
MAVFADLQPATILLIAVIAYGTAVFHSVGGFAGGLLLTICLAPILGVKESVPVTATALILSHCTRAWVFRRAIQWRIVAAVFVSALPGIVLGAIVYVRLPVHWVAAVLGIFLAVTVPLRRVLHSRNFKVGLGGLSAAGVPYGLISGTTIGAGMMLAPFLLGAGLFGEQLIAVVAALGLGLNLTKTVVFGISPLLTPSLALQGLLIGLCTIPGAYTGRWIVKNTPIRIHTLFMEAFVLTGAGYFLWQAGKGFG